MRSFEQLLDLAAARHGGRAAVLAGVAVPKTAEELAATRDEDWLAQMARVVLHAGISWKVIEAKWPGIEAALGGFAVAPVAAMDEARLARLLADPRLIRSAPKLAAIRANAGFIQRVAAESGSFGRRIAFWPVEEHAALLAWLAGEGARLGGTSGQNVLRFMGRDTWLLTSDVLARLRAEGVIAGAPTSARAQAAIQAAFDGWRAGSGLGLAAISHVLALGIDSGSSG